MTDLRMTADFNVLLAYSHMTKERLQPTRATQDQLRTPCCISRRVRSKNEKWNGALNPTTWPLGTAPLRVVVKIYLNEMECPFNNIIIISSLCLWTHTDADVHV